MAQLRTETNWVEAIASRLELEAIASRLEDVGSYLVGVWGLPALVFSRWTGSCSSG